MTTGNVWIRPVDYEEDLHHHPRDAMVPLAISLAYSNLVVIFQFLFACCC